MKGLVNARVPYRINLSKEVSFIHVMINDMYLYVCYPKCPLIEPIPLS
ncbi:hypothetical protein BH10BAC3_BH10BAC3_10060 [soil metagenome]